MPAFSLKRRALSGRFSFSPGGIHPFPNPPHDQGAIKHDGFVKSPTAALCFIFLHCGVLYVRLIPQDLQALHLELFTLPSEF